MVSLDLDLAGVLKLLVDTASCISEKHQRDKREREADRDLAFTALSRHPALDYMTPLCVEPRWEVLDHYRIAVRKRKKCILSVDIGERNLFYHASHLGEVGVKARIIMLLLWITAKSVREGTDITSIVSRAILSNMPKGEPNVFNDFSGVVDEFVALFETDIPKEIDEMIPVQQIAHYELLPGIVNTLFVGYEPTYYDVTMSPSALLNFHGGRIFTPKDDHAERFMVWLTRKLYMGRLVTSPTDVVENVCWNAYLPQADVSATPEDLPPESVTDIEDGERPPSWKLPLSLGRRPAQKKPAKQFKASKKAQKETPVLVQKYPDLPNDGTRAPIQASKKARKETSVPVQKNPDSQIDGTSAPMQASPVLSANKNDEPHDSYVETVARELLRLHRATKSEENSQLLAYFALSIHPVLDQIPLRKPDFMVSPVLHNHRHFRSLPDSGIIRKKILVMMSLLWIIGHRLLKDKIATFVSTTIEDCLKRAQDVLASVGEIVAVPEEGGSQHPFAFTDFPTLTILRSIDSTVDEIAQMILKPSQIHRDPFSHSRPSASDEDALLATSSVNDPTEQRYEYDVKASPSALLRPQRHIVIVPKTRLSMFVVKRVVDDFDLGRSTSHSDDRRSTYWTADLRDRRQSPPVRPEIEPERSFSPLPVYAGFVEPVFSPIRPNSPGRDDDNGQSPLVRPEIEVYGSAMEMVEISFLPPPVNAGFVEPVFSPIRPNSSGHDDDSRVYTVEPQDPTRMAAPTEWKADSDAWAYERPRQAQSQKEYTERESADGEFASMRAREMRAHEMRAREMRARETRADEMGALEMRARGMRARGMLVK